MENVMTVRLREIDRVAARLQEPDTLSVVLGEAAVIEKAKVDYGGADWAQNDPAGAGYVKGRTHWVDDDGTVHQISETFLPEADGADALEIMADAGIITPAYQDGTIYTADTGEIYTI